MAGYRARDQCTMDGSMVNVGHRRAFMLKRYGGGSSTAGELHVHSPDKKKINLSNQVAIAIRLAHVVAADLLSWNKSDFCAKSWQRRSQLFSSCLLASKSTSEKK